MDAKSVAEFDKILEEAGSSLVVIHFWAKWAPQCQQISDVMAELAKDTQFTNTKFVQVEAESVPEISLRYDITAVPTCVLLQNKTAVDRVNGANAPELTKKVHLLGAPGSIAPPPPAPAAKPQDIKDRLKSLINTAPVMVFMKGKPEEPRCGFSRQLVQLFNEQNVKFNSFDILTDEVVRQELKTYSNWPTYPQLYVKGELVGGLDIIKELIESGEFKDTLPAQESLEDRMKALINKEPVMLFMKGSPDAVKCGFSRTMIGILKEEGAKFGHFDILSDEEIRQGLKTYSNWPTYPQLYVKGNLVGGVDIVKELKESGELAEALKGE